MTAVYDRIGGGYAEHRRPDPRWAAAIHAALGEPAGPAGGGATVDVGAGTGSYEPVDRPVVAVEPSAVMLAQRPRSQGPAVQAAADALPFPDDAFDAALAVLTVHHWPGHGRRGLQELRRVARRRIVVLTWDPAFFADAFWLVRDYLPEVADHERTLPTLDAVTAGLGDTAEVRPLPVPADCTDGVLGAYWQRPRAYLDPGVRSAMSGLALLDQGTVEGAMARLKADLDSGAWARRHADLRNQAETDLGYRLVVSSP